MTERSVGAAGVGFGEANGQFRGLEWNPPRFGTPRTEDGRKQATNTWQSQCTCETQPTCATEREGEEIRSVRHRQARWPVKHLPRALLHTATVASAGKQVLHIAFQAWVFESLDFPIDPREIA